MATVCPLCGVNNLKKGEKMVYCAEYKPRKIDKDWVNEGSCEFHVALANKYFTLTPNDIKKLLEGGTIKNGKGDTISLDLDSDYYTKIVFAPRKEDKDF